MQTPRGKEELELCYRRVCNPDDMVREFSLCQHPLVAAWKRKTRVKSKLRDLSKIIYRCDMQALFTDFSDAQKTHARASDRVARKAASLLVQDAPEAVTFDALLSRCCVEHARATLSHGAFCSLGPLRAGEPFPLIMDTHASFNSHHRGSMEPRPAALKDMQLDADIDNGAEHCKFGKLPRREPPLLDPTGSRLLFRVLHPKPVSMKTSRKPIASGGRLAQSDVAITMHAVVGNDNLEGGAERPDSLSDPLVMLQPSLVPGSSCVVMMMRGLSRCTPHALETQFHEWHGRGALQYTFQDVKTDATCGSEALHRMIAADAFPNMDKYLTIGAADEHLCVYKQWEHAGLVSMRSGGDDLATFAVAFTSGGAAQLSACYFLRRPEPAIRVRPAICLQDRTSYELIKMLDTDGWSWARLPSSAKQRSTLMYLPDGEKTWYSQSTYVAEHTRYFMCLLRSEDLFRDGVTYIPHYSAKPAQTYSQILKGRNPAPLLALEAEDIVGKSHAPGRRRIMAPSDVPEAPQYSTETQACARQKM